MIKKTIFALFLAAMAIVPFASGTVEAATASPEGKEIARVNWNINIGGWGGCYQPPPPCYYPYYYPCPPPCAYPCPPYGAGFWIW